MRMPVGVQPVFRFNHVGPLSTCTHRDKKGAYTFRYLIHDERGENCSLHCSAIQLNLVSAINRYIRERPRQDINDNLSVPRFTDDTLYSTS